MTDPTLTLKKSLQRVQAQTDPIMKYAIQLKERDASLTDEEAYRAAEEILSREGPRRVRTEEDAMDDEELKAWKAVVYATVSKVFGANDPALRNEFAKEFESQIKDVTQPQGGTENLTNVRTPGQPPAKIPAEPGKSGSNETGSYRTADQPVGSTYNNPTSPGNPRGNSQPNYRLNRQSPGQNWDQVGPVGERGDLASIPTYETRIIPGKIAPSDQYRGTGPTPRVPSREMPEGGNIERPTIHNQPSYPDIDTSVTAKAFGSATDQREAEQLMGKAFIQALDEADLDKHSMAFDLRRAGMGTVKEVDPNLVASIPIIRKEFDRLARSGPEYTDTAADESRFDYDHFKKAFELEKQASGMRRLAADQELAGDLAGRDDLRHKALLLDREAAEIRKQVHEPSLNRTLRTVLSKPVK